MLRKVASVLVTIIGGFVVLLVLMALLGAVSSTETLWDCNGTVEAFDREYDSTVYVRLEDYRWWVSLWADHGSEGSIWIEAPRDPALSVYVYPRVYFSDTLMRFLERDGTERGNYFPISRTLSFRPRPDLHFLGTCERSPDR